MFAAISLLLFLFINSLNAEVYVIEGIYQADQENPDGTYTVWCEVNPNSPFAIIVTPGGSGTSCVTVDPNGISKDVDVIDYLGAEREGDTVEHTFMLED